MALLSSLGAILTVSGTPEPGVEAVLTVSPDPFVPTTTTVTADITYDNALASSAYPGTAHQLLVGFRVYVDDVLVDPAVILPGMTVTRTLGAPATWTLPLATRTDWPTVLAYPLGRPEGYIGPPPGGARVDIDGVYATSSGVKAVRLVTNGVVENCEERFGALDTHQLNGLGPAGRYGGRKVTLSVPAGHGQQRRAVAGTVAAAMGITDVALVAAGRMDKAIQEVETPGMDLLANILLPSGRVPNFTAAGTLADPERVVRSGPYDVVLDDADLMLSPDVGRQSAKDGPTRITVEGERQVTREGCEVVTTVRWVEEVAEHTKREATHQQNSNGTLTALTPVQFPQLQVVSRVTTIEERDCGRLITSRVITQEMHLPGAWRYELATNGTHSAYSTYYLYDSGAVQDDAALAYAWRTERLVTVSDALTTYEYDDDGFGVGSTQVVRGWHQRRTAVKEQAPMPTVPWEEEPFIADVPVLGNGEGVFDLVETYFGPYHEVARNQGTGWEPQVGGGTIFVLGSIGVTRKVHSIPEIERHYDADGELRGGGIVREAETEETWDIRRVGGGPYYFADTNESKSTDPTELFRLATTLTTTNIAQEGDGSHDRLTALRDYAGRRVDGEPDRYEAGLEGYLPAAERDVALEPDTTSFPDGLPASQRETHQVECTYEVPTPPGWEERVERIHDPWIETEAEACRFARDEASLRWAMRVTATVPIAFPLMEGMRVLININRVALHLPVHVKSVTHTLPAPLDFATTTLTGDVYVL